MFLKPSKDYLLAEILYTFLLFKFNIMLNSSDFSIDMNDCELSNLNFVLCSENERGSVNFYLYFCCEEEII